MVGQQHQAELLLTVYSDIDPPHITLGPPEPATPRRRLPPDQLFRIDVMTPAHSTLGSLKESLESTTGVEAHLQRLFVGYNLTCIPVTSLIRAAICLHTLSSNYS